MRPSDLDTRLTIACFLLLLWLPAGLRLAAPPAELSETEKRSLAALPELAWSRPALEQLPRQLEDWWDDHMGLRDDLIRGWAWLHVRLLGGSPSDKLVVGKNGWLFFGDPSALSQYRGTARFDGAELDRWAAVLEERRDWLAARGVPFLLVLVPNKHRVYGEEMPDALRPVADRSQLDQLVDRLAADGEVSFLDLRPVLEDAAREVRVYHKTDTHWNDRGAYAAYRAILARLAEIDPALAPAPPAAVRAFERTRPGLGLAQIVGLGRALPERSLDLAVIEPRAELPPARRAVVADRLRRQQPFGLGTGDPDLPHAVVFHDSFIEALLPFLAESFSRVSFFWQPDVVPWVVETERPDLVIQEIAERFLGRRPLSISEVELQTRHLRRQTRGAFGAGESGGASRP